MSTTPERRRRRSIALLSFADIDNYGDKFFATIGSAELLRRLPDASIVLFSPTGATVEGAQYVAYERSALQNGFDAAILLGGEVVHTLGRMLSDVYERIGRPRPLRDPVDVVLDWATLDIKYKAWISVGAPRTDPPSDSRTLAEAIVHLDRIAARGLLSKEMIEGYVGDLSGVEVVPDLGWLIPRHVADPARPWWNLANRVGIESPDEPYLVFQTLSACLPSPETAIIIADSLKRIRKNTGLRIALLPVCGCWEDHKTLRMIQDAGGGDFALLPHGLTVLETASVLLNASLYLGSSMHGAITCLSAGIPSGVIYPPAESKFTELFGAQMRLDALVRDWSDLDGLAFRLTNERRSTLAFHADTMTRRLDDLFDSVVEDIRIAGLGTASPADPRPSDRPRRLRRFQRELSTTPGDQLDSASRRRDAAGTRFERSLAGFVRMLSGSDRATRS